MADTDGNAQWHTLPTPTRADLDAVAQDTCWRTLRLLRKQGRWLDEENDTLAETELEATEPALAQLAAGSIAGKLVFESGSRPMRLHAAAAREPGEKRNGYGFDLHAAVLVPAKDRPKRERLCRYMLRPPIAHRRLHELPDGTYRLELKRAWSDGTNHLVFTGPELVARLAALVPPPRMHTIRFHGVFAPRATLRRSVVPAPSAPEPDACPHEGHTAPPTKRRLDWAKLMARVFAIDVLECPKCQGCMQRIAFISEPRAIRRILESVGLAQGPPPPAPAVVPEQHEFWG